MLQAGIEHKAELVEESKDEGQGTSIRTNRNKMQDGLSVADGWGRLENVQTGKDRSGRWEGKDQ